MGRKRPSSSKEIKSNFVKAHLNFSVTSIINEDLHINFGQRTAFLPRISICKHEPQSLQKKFSLRAYHTAPHYPLRRLTEDSCLDQRCHTDLELTHPAQNILKLIPLLNWWHTWTNSCKLTEFCHRLSASQSPSEDLLSILTFLSGFLTMKGKF